MAIKIIKQGTKEFHTICPFCSCEFTYENEDVHDSSVICPCCFANVPHIPIWHNQQVVHAGYNESSCESCPNNPKYFKEPYVGDIPCQWCQKSPYKSTC